MFTCDLLGVNRQVYYRAKQAISDKQKLANKVIELVRSIRAIMPKLGTRKLYDKLKIQLSQLSVGRDKLFDILRANHMLIKPKKKYHVTTNSHHRFKKHQNLITNLDFDKPEQVWVSDITYIGSRNKPCYLALITDAYSKKIVGYDVSNSLQVCGTLRALDMAIKSRIYTQTPLIHHSDRGLQYCSNEYQRILDKNNITASMTQKYDPYENAIAERINGILKQEFDIDKYNLELDVKKNLVKNAIEIYNNFRPHLSNHMLTPNQMHRQNKLKRKQYKKKKGSNLKSLPLNY